MRILHCAAIIPVLNSIITHPNTSKGQLCPINGTKFVSEIHEVHMRTLKNTCAFNDNYKNKQRET